MDKDPGAPKKKKVQQEFDININEFGEVTSNISIDRINDFLNRELQDKKLTNQRSDTDEEE
ncbi:MAG TPA: hypothetical protein P5275_16575 [Saprospiraceae bacterium]|nr:hypothetical protein [Saprospiraceae bacterium]MCB9271896.1 hypothetical protein [Lewinellaceae bacterium]HPG09420.1 hypothetical protein [Saprospiraceae bacterium]HPR00859.1 hypothetical protein [Saprospiraceae bacterium]HQU51538.1 hypothetical protein [Saprospiraceae bacterium]